MRKAVILIVLIALIAVPVQALDITAPEVPNSAADLMPDSPETFAEGLWELIKEVTAKVQPELTEAAGCCLSLFCATLLTSVFQSISGGRGKKAAELVCTLWIAVTLLQPTRSLVNLGANTITEMTQYGKLLLPVMTAALAAQGGIT